MPQTVASKVERGLWFLFGLRFCQLFVACFYSLSNPHSHRQFDTLGISLRYFNRFAYEPPENSFLLRFLPAALNSSDSFGYVVTEFPWLNLLLSPVFALGPYWGLVVARVLLLILVFGGLALSARLFGSAQFRGIPLRFSCLLFPLFALGATYSGRFIPEPLAVVFVLLSLSLSWQKPRPVLSGLFSTLGLLLKPTSVVLLAWVLLHPGPLRLKKWSWMGISLIIAGFYYVWAVPHLLPFQDWPSAFNVQLRSPIQNLLDFFTDYRGLLRLVGRVYFTQVGLILLLLGYLLTFSKRTDRSRWLWLLLGFQTLVIGMLDGVHAYLHPYYYMGAFPTICLIVEDLSLRVWPKQGWLVYVFATVAFVSLGRFVTRELQLKDPTAAYTESFRDTCETLRHRNSGLPWHQGYVFRTHQENYPILGTCFGERTNSLKSRYGFYEVDSVPPSCRILDQEGKLAIADCKDF